jgi:hypothetical protein
MKKYDIVIYSRANFECFQLETSAANVDEACNQWESVLREHLLSNFEGDDPADYDEETLDEVVESEFESGEYYIVCAFESSAENKLVF